MERWQRVRHARGGDLAWHEFDGSIELHVPGRNKGNVVNAVLGEMPRGAAAQLQCGARAPGQSLRHRGRGRRHTYRACSMPLEERRLRRSIREYDIFWWANSFLKTAISRDLSAFPLPEDYIPRTDISQMPWLAEA